RGGRRPCEQAASRRRRTAVPRRSGLERRTRPRRTAGVLAACIEVGSLAPSRAADRHPRVTFTCPGRERGAGLGSLHAFDRPQRASISSPANLTTGELSSGGPTTLGEQRGAVPAPADFGAARRAAPRSGPRRWNRREA